MAYRDLLPRPLRGPLIEIRRRVAWHMAPDGKVKRAWIKHYGLTVRSGPFAGMTLTPFVAHQSEILVGRLLGSYECEIADAVERLIQWKPDTVVNLGASDGYYAVGLARRLPQATIEAYETRVEAGAVCKTLAEANGVAERVRMHGEATLATLGELPSGKRAVFCDIEGGEVALLDPEVVPSLRRAALLVELHDLLVPDATATIISRFNKSHDVTVIDSQSRYIGQWPDLQALPGVSYADREIGISEFRGMPQQWALMLPRSI